MRTCLNFPPTATLTPLESSFVSFVSSLLSIDPGKRPTAAEALEHPFLEEVRAMVEDGGGLGEIFYGTGGGEEEDDEEEDDDDEDDDGVEWEEEERRNSF